MSAKPHLLFAGMLALAVRGPRTSRRDWRGDARAAAGLFLYVPILIIGRGMFTFAQSVSRTLQRWFA